VAISPTLLGQLLEGKARSQTSVAVQSLLECGSAVGESMRVGKTAGDSPIGATLNTRGAPVMHAD